MNEILLRSVVRESILKENSSAMLGMMALWDSLNPVTVEEVKIPEDVKQLKSVLDDIMYIHFRGNAKGFHKTVQEISRKIIEERIFETDIQSWYNGFYRTVKSETSSRADIPVVEKIISDSSRSAIIPEIHRLLKDEFLKELEKFLMVKLTGSETNTLLERIQEELKNPGDNLLERILNSVSGFYYLAVEKDLKDAETDVGISIDEFNTNVGYEKALAAALKISSDVSIGGMFATGKVAAEFGTSIFTLSESLNIMLRGLSLTARYSAHVFAATVLIGAIFKLRKVAIKQSQINDFIKSSLEIVKIIIIDTMDDIEKKLVELGPDLEIIYNLKKIGNILKIDSAKISSKIEELKDSLDDKENYSMIQDFWSSIFGRNEDVSNEEEIFKISKNANKNLSIDGERATITVDDFSRVLFASDSIYMKHIYLVCTSYAENYSLLLQTSWQSINAIAQGLKGFIEGTYILAEIESEKQRLNDALGLDDHEERETKYNSFSQSEVFSKYSDISFPPYDFPVSIGSNFSAKLYEGEEVVDTESVFFELFGNKKDSPYFNEGEKLFTNNPGDFDASQAVGSAEDEVEIVDVIYDYFQVDETIRNKFKEIKISPFIGIWQNKKYFIPIKRGT